MKLALIIFSVFVTGCAGQIKANLPPVTQVQATKLCKIVDPVFINQVNVIAEFRRQGVEPQKATAAVRVSRVYYHAMAVALDENLNAMEVLQTSKFDTAEEAIAILEKGCQAKLMGWVQ